METSCLSLLACPIDYLVVEPLWKKKLGVDYWKFLFRNLCLPRYPIGEQNLFRVVGHLDYQLEKCHLLKLKQKKKYVIVNTQSSIDFVKNASK